MGWPYLARLAHRLLVLQASMADMRVYEANRSDASFMQAVRFAFDNCAEPAAIPAHGASRLRPFIEATRQMLKVGRPIESESEITRPFRALLDRNLASLAKRCGRHPDGADSASIETGYCIAPLNALFEEMLRLANCSYEGHALSVTLDTAHLASRPTDSLDLGCKAVTTDGDSQGRRVRLDVHVPSFADREYLACPYIFFHEIFCHAASGLAPSAIDLSEAFSDGWMDWVATETLGRYLREGALSAPLRPLSEQLNEHAVSVSARRYVTGGAAPELAAHFDIGRRTAKQMRQLFSAVAGNDHAGWRAMHDFSVALNASPASDKLRHTFVWACIQFLPHSSLPGEMLADAPEGVVWPTHRYLTSDVYTAVDLARDFVVLSST